MSSDMAASFTRGYKEPSAKAMELSICTSVKNGGAVRRTETSSRRFYPLRLFIRLMACGCSTWRL